MEVMTGLPLTTGRRPPGPVVNPPDIMGMQIILRLFFHSLTSQFSLHVLKPSVWVARIVWYCGMWSCMKLSLMSSFMAKIVMVMKGLESKPGSLKCKAFHISSDGFYPAVGALCGGNTKVHSSYSFSHHHLPV